jgi:serine/threonine-protein kinase RsbW
VRLELDGERCAISVTDVGRHIDVTAVTGDMPHPSSPRGRGVAMMQAITDQIDFTSEPEVGTIVHLVKRLSFEPGS